MEEEYTVNNNNNTHENVVNNQNNNYSQDSSNNGNSSNNNVSALKESLIKLSSEYKKLSKEDKDQLHSSCSFKQTDYLDNDRTRTKTRNHNEYRSNNINHSNNTTSTSTTITEAERREQDYKSFCAKRQFDDYHLEDLKKEYGREYKEQIRWFKDALKNDKPCVDDYKCFTHFRSKEVSDSILMDYINAGYSQYKKSLQNNNNNRTNTNTNTNTNTHNANIPIPNINNANNYQPNSSINNSSFLRNGNESVSDYRKRIRKLEHSIKSPK